MKRSTGIKDKEGKEIFEGDEVKDSVFTYTVRFGEYSGPKRSFIGFYLEHPINEYYNGPFCSQDSSVLLKIKKTKK